MQDIIMTSASVTGTAKLADLFAIKESTNLVVHPIAFVVDVNSYNFGNFRITTKFFLN